MEFDAPARVGGTSKYTLRQLWALASSAFFSFSTVPIKVATRLGVLMMSGSFGYLAYILGMYLIVGVVTPGWASGLVPPVFISMPPFRTGHIST